MRPAHERKILFMQRAFSFYAEADAKGENT